MKKSTRFTALILTLTLAIALLSACSEKTDTSGFYLYANDLTEALGIKDISVPDFTGRRGSVVFSRDRVREKDTEWIYRSFDLRSGEDDVIAVRIPQEHEYPGVFKRGRGIELSTCAALPDGGVLQVMYKPKAMTFVPNETTGETDTIVTDISPQLLLLLTDPQGVVTKMIDISELSEEFLSPYPLVAVDSGSNIILCPEDGGREFVCVPVDGEPEVVGLPESLGENVRLSGCDGIRFYSITTDDDDKSACTYVTYENGGFSKPRTIPLSVEPSEVGFIGDKVWYSTVDGAFLAGEKGTEKLFDWFDLGLDSGYILYKALFDADSGVVFYIVETGAKVESAYIKRSDFSEYLAWYAEKHGVAEAEALNEQQLVNIVACETQYYDGSALISPVSGFLRNLNRFRRSNMQYDLKLTRLSGSESDAASALMRRMLAGEVPDVVVFADNLKSRNFRDTSLFSDLYTFMDKDSEYGRDAFLPCVTSSFEDKDGRLPYLTTKFSFRTLTGLRVNFEKSGWTLGEFLDFAEKLPADKKLTDIPVLDQSKASVMLLNYLIGGLVDDFIDYDNKTCDFESENFKRLLKVIKEANIGTNNGLDVRGFMNGDIMLEIGDMNNIPFYLYGAKAVFFGKEVTTIGFPGGEKRDMAVISPSMQLAIPEGCENPGGGWTLIRTHVDTDTKNEKDLIETREDKYASWSLTRPFLCTWEATNAMLDYSTQMHMTFTAVEYTKSDGTRHMNASAGCAWNYRYEFDKKKRENVKVRDDYDSRERLDAAWENTKKYYQKNLGATEITGMSAAIDFEESDRESIRAILSSECRVISQDTKAMSIIKEEAEEYFNGRKSLEDAVRMIQNRVLTRINE